MIDPVIRWSLQNRAAVIVAALTLMLMGVLLLMGGLAPMQVRTRMSKRQRKLLDD